jgi:hypothetical protein
MIQTPRITYRDCEQLGNELAGDLEAFYRILLESVMDVLKKARNSRMTESEIMEAIDRLFHETGEIDE